MKGPTAPKPFLEVRVHELSICPPLTGVCAGYELNKWRSAQLAGHLIEWLPEFALNHSELEAFGPNNAVALIAQAAKMVYLSSKFKNRGEVGEILLHVVLRQVFNTIPAVSKIFYKDSSNDTVKGFDAVHVVATQTKLELWLGEVKLYTSIKKAIEDALGEIEKHTARDYLRSEFIAITNKIDPSWPHAEKLKKLLDKNTSLDEVFDCACIPVLLAYDSQMIAKFHNVSQEFKAAFEKEIREYHKSFSIGMDLSKIRVHLILLPMASKKELLECFDARLKSCQGITM